MISLKDYLTASGKYPERENHPELTPQILDNAKKLLAKVNNLLTELGIAQVFVSSGFRPSEVNKGIPNAAKKSLHMTCQAIDIQDPDGSLDELLDEGDELLKRYGLWQESPDATKGWSHLDMKDRGTRKKNQFIP